jgi:hypothetical protein
LNPMEFLAGLELLGSWALSFVPDWGSQALPVQSHWNSPELWSWEARPTFRPQAVEFPGERSGEQYVKQRHRGSRWQRKGQCTFQGNARSKALGVKGIRVIILS